MERRLVAILAADVVGYSRLMRANEDATVASLKACRKTIDEIVAAHSGRIFGHAGDSVVAEFPSPVEAVRCATKIQLALEEKDAERPEGRRMRFRIGINLGDVIVEDGNLLGDGVNIAARLQGLAEPGGICISEIVRDLVSSKLDVHYEDLGAQALKNIADPVRAYRVMVEGAPAQKDASPGASAQPESIDTVLARPAVAVLPFANLSCNPEQGYFSDGLSEDIITALALWRSFPVIARNSSFSYKGRAVDAKRIGRELGARYLLEGSVRKSGSRLRIAAQLIEAASGHHLWAERYDRELEDVFALQDEIAERISVILVPTMAKAELLRSQAKQPENLDAWDYCLRGRAALQDWTKEGTKRARALFRSAIALDPNYSDAFTDLAWTYSRDLLTESAEDREASAAQMYKAACRAVALDEASSRARHRLSTAHLWRNEHELAIAEGRRALALNPMNAEARHALGNKLDLAGDPQGVAMMEQAQRLNPEDAQRHMHLTFLARAYINAGEHEKAVERARDALHRRPSFPHALYILAIGLGHLGRAEEAQAALEECEALQPGFVAKRRDWQPYLEAARNGRLHEGLAKAGW